MVHLCWNCKFLIDYSQKTRCCLRKPKENCQERMNVSPIMAGFVGVFDGHDGNLASEYCSQGLVPHIIAEHGARCAPPSRNSWSFANDSATAALDIGVDCEKQDLEISYIAAFQKSHQRFCNHIGPPTFEEVCKCAPLRTERPRNYNPAKWLMHSTPAQKGGSTACTVAVVST